MSSSMMFGVVSCSSPHWTAADHVQLVGLVTSGGLLRSDASCVRPTSVGIRKNDLEVMHNMILHLCMYWIFQEVHSNNLNYNWIPKCTNVFIYIIFIYLMHTKNFLLNHKQFICFYFREVCLYLLCNVIKRCFCTGLHAHSKYLPSIFRTDYKWFWWVFWFGIK